MQYKNRAANNFLGLVLLLCISRVCQGQLMCYVCDNCAQITAQTPKFECNDDFFNTSGPTDSSVQTTTHRPNTTVDVTETATTDEATLTSTTIHAKETTTTTTTEAKLPESTTSTTTENITEPTTETITETTTLKEIEPTTEEEKQPSPTTVGSRNSTNAVATSPSPGTLKPLDDVESLNNQTAVHEQHVNKDEVEDLEIEQATTKSYKPSAEFRVRQLRSTSDLTFSCFKVHATAVNGTMVVSRGCSRVRTSETVCEQWQAQHTSEKMDKCYPCSRTKCNSSSALNVSISALILAAVALFMHRK